MKPFTPSATEESVVQTERERHRSNNCLYGEVMGEMGIGSREAIAILGPKGIIATNDSYT